MRFIPFVAFAVVMVNCTTKTPYSSGQEVAVLKGNFYEQVKDSSVQAFGTVSKIWYEDSFAIEQVSMFNVVLSDSGRRSESIVERYRFSDLRKRWAYDYKHLADTAVIMRKYTYGDSVEIVSGWGFLSKRNMTPDSMGAPVDTTINGTLYKRVKISASVRGMRVPMDCLFRCDDSKTVFDFDPPLSAKVGCPLVKIFALTPDRKFITASSEVEVVSRKFEDSVVKVFKAWKNNLKTNPVK